MIYRVFAFVFVCSSLAGLAQDFQPSPAVKKLTQEILETNGKGEFYSIPDFRSKSADRSLPIGIFDSGIGGLTVLETILNLDTHNNASGQPGQDGIPDFQGEKFVYLGDQANMPYGNYASAQKEDLLRELILRDVLFLFGDRYWSDATAVSPRFDKPSVKAIVIACNTATAYGLEDIRYALQEWKMNIPVIGVVEAGANALVQELPRTGQAGGVGVMATLGTCSSGAYPKAISKSAGLAGKRQPTVWQQGSVGLAGAIEGNPSFVGGPTGYQGPSTSNPAAKIESDLIDVYGFDPQGLEGELSDPASWRLKSVGNYVRYDVVSMVESYRRSGSQTPLSSIILGCTHFPFESERILQELERLRTFKRIDGTTPYSNLISPNLELIDPGVLTAKQLFRTLVANRVRSERSDSAPSIDRMFVSVPNRTLSLDLTAEGNFTNEYKYGRTAGSLTVEDYRFVPLTKQNTPSTLQKLLSENCSKVWQQLGR